MSGSTSESHRISHCIHYPLNMHGTQHTHHFISYHITHLPFFILATDSTTPLPVLSPSLSLFRYPPTLMASSSSSLHTTAWARLHELISWPSLIFHLTDKMCRFDCLGDVLLLNECRRTAGEDSAQMLDFVAPMCPFAPNQYIFSFLFSTIHCTS